MLPILLASTFFAEDTITNAIITVVAIMVAMAVISPNGNMLTLAEIKPPSPICIKPSNADAVPALFENGAIQSAAALG